MLLTILEEQAMDSLLLGSDKENDFMQLILHTMERQSDGNKLYLLNAFEFCDDDALLKSRGHYKNWGCGVEKRGMNILWCRLQIQGSKSEGTFRV